MDILSWTLVISILGVTIYYYYRKKRHDFDDWGIPHPRELPFLGIVGSNLIRRVNFATIFKDWYDLNKDAKYVGVHSFFTPLIILREPDLIKSIMVKDFDHFSDHKAFLDESLDPLLSKNLAALNGEKWHEVRSLLSPAFTSNKMRVMFELMDKCGRTFTEGLVEQYAEEPEIDVKEAFSKYTNDVIATCAFGIEIDSLKDPKNEFYVNGRKMMNSEGWTLMIQFFKAIFAVTFPRLAKIFNIKLLPQRISDFFVNIIDTAIKTRDEQGIERPDMLQLMMAARDNAKIKLDIVDMTAQAFVFFFAGFETTSAQMSLIAHELACNPEVQVKVVAEVDATMEAAQGKLTYEAVANMPFLDAVFQEIMRLHTQVPFLSRHCTKPYELPPTLPGAKPYLIKPGDEIAVPVTGIHRDPVYYEQPEKFDPERYLGRKPTTSDVTNLGFGLGPRMCIGNRFAILETKVLFCHLLRRCTFEPCVKTCVPLKYGWLKVGPYPNEGFWLKLKAR